MIAGEGRGTTADGGLAITAGATQDGTADGGTAGTSLADSIDTCAPQPPPPAPQPAA